jgi:hypothetical protein
LATTVADDLGRAPHGLPQPGVMAVWARLRKLAHLPLEARCVAWRVLHGALYCGAFRLRVSSACSLPQACCGLPGCEGVLQGLSHMFLHCPGVALAVDWFCLVWEAVEGAKPPPLASVFLADDLTAWRPPVLLAALWGSLRVMFLFSVSRCTRAVSGMQSPDVFARAIVAHFVRNVRMLISQDWGRVVSRLAGVGVQPLSCAAFEQRWCHRSVLAAVSAELPEAGLGEMRVLLTCSHPAVLVP